MDEADTRRLEENLMCPVCHDIFKDPRLLPCGHSLCLDCLESVIDYSCDAPLRCPDCRADFGQVDGIQRSFTLTNIAEDFRIHRQMKMVNPSAPEYYGVIFLLLFCLSLLLCHLICGEPEAERSSDRSTEDTTEPCGPVIFWDERTKETNRRWLAGQRHI